MHKIGEIWVDDGSGCLGWVILIIIVSVIALPVMAGFWLWNAGSNFVSYGTIDTEVAHVRATATAVTLESRALATAMAPIEADSAYYTHLAERANVSVGTVFNFGYDGNEDKIYFTVDFVNGDDQSHTIDVVFRGSNGYQFSRKISLSPGHNLQKIIDPPKTYIGVRFGQSQFGGMSLDARDLGVKIERIDGFPLRDPRDVLSKLDVQISKFQYQRVYAYDRNDVVLRVVVTNNDNLSHAITGYADYTYTYRYLGDLKSKSDKLAISKVLQPGQTLDVSEDLPLWIKDSERILINKVVIELADPVTDSVPSSVKTKIFTSPDWDYRR